MGLSFVALFAINKARTGSAAAVQDLLPKFSAQDLIIILVTITISAIIAFIIAVNLAKLATKFINFLPYKTLNISIIILVILINIFLSNWLGLIVLVLATLLGMYCIHSSVRRINLMGCLIIPSITYYLMN
jgi:TctA family transporter